MPATEQDETIWQGDDLLIRPDGGVTDSDGSTVNLDGASIVYAISQSPTEPAKVKKSVSGGGVTITDAPNGMFEVDIDPEDTSDLSGRFYHECEVTLKDGKTYTVFVGNLTVKETAIE